MYKQSFLILKVHSITKQIICTFLNYEKFASYVLYLQTSKRSRILPFLCVSVHITISYLLLIEVLPVSLIGFVAVSLIVVVVAVVIME